MKISLRLLPVWLTVSGWLAAVAFAGDARQILNATGFQGGFIVHLGCGDATQTAAFRASESCIVQGLDTAPEKIQAARRRLVQSQVNGPVTVREFDGAHLPYASAMVNLLVVENPFAVAPAEMQRVLAPKGTLCLREGGQWKFQTKAWPAELDEWTHYQHDPQGSMVGKDKIVGPPKRIQWMGDPKWLRNHDFMSSMDAMVSAGGRIFYIIDEGLRQHVFLPAQWTLIARDAFNGAVLWKRPLKDWHPANWPLKSGPGYLPRRLVAVGDRVYATLGLLEPVSVLDAATGNILGTYESTRTAEEIVCDKGEVFVLADPKRQPVGYRAQTQGYKEIEHANGGWGWTKASPPRSVVAVEANSGKPLWNFPTRIAPLTLTVADKQVYFFDGDRMVALDRQTGKVAWMSETPQLALRAETGAAPRVIVSDGVILLCSHTKLFAFSAENGKILWDGNIPPTGHHSPSDLFVINGWVWSAHTGANQQNGTHLVALNLKTGKTQRDFVANNLPGFPMHPRCYPGRATESFLMLPGMGAEFFSVGGTAVDIHNYIRGSCLYGLMPANGLLYKPPDTCACYYMSKLEYLCALAPATPKTETLPAVPDDRRLERGPAFAEVAKLKADVANSDWPMYRHDNTRSGASGSPVPPALKPAWEIKLGGQLTQPVVAAGKVLVAAKDGQTIHALAADSGKTLWTFTAGGRIDSAPTISGGKVVFGSADGWAYCLRLEDGALAWRYLLAPADRQILAFQQPESTWPVSGSLVVHNNTVYGLAGRNMFFDGGMRLVRLDAATGKKISETVLDENDPKSGKNLQSLIVHKSMPVANADLLSCDGKYVYMATRLFDLEGKRVGAEPVSSGAKPGQVEETHLFCPTGLLDDLWYHRSYYIYGPTCHEGWAEYPWAQNQFPCGRIIAVDDSRVYGFRADGLGNQLLPTPMYRLYAADKTLKLDGQGGAGKAGKKGGRKKAQAPNAEGQGLAGPYKVYWQIPSPPLLVNALTVGGKTLFVAGPPDVADETKMLGFLPGANDEINRQLQNQNDAWHGKQGMLLWAISTQDGKKLAEYKFPGLPVFDGLIAAAGRLYMSTQDGRLVCLGN